MLCYFSPFWFIIYNQDCNNTLTHIKHKCLPGDAYFLANDIGIALRARNCQPMGVFCWMSEGVCFRHCRKRGLVSFLDPNTRYLVGSVLGHYLLKPSSACFGLRLAPHVSTTPLLGAFYIVLFSSQPDECSAPAPAVSGNCHF